MSLSRATKFQALGLVGSFRENGMMRRMHIKSKHGGFAYVNDLLTADGMPPVPDVFLKTKTLIKSTHSIFVWCRMGSGI
jgi:hypothetical protein